MGDSLSHLDDLLAKDQLSKVQKYCTKKHRIKSH